MSTWIFLRGLTREARHWGELPAMWQARGLGQPITIDLPGNGTQAYAPVPNAVRGMLDAVRAEAKRRDIVPPYRILAMSLGAMVATDWAQTYPEEVAGLVLINTSMRPFCSVSERLRPDTWAALLGMARHWQDRVRCERTIHRLTCERLDTRDADIAAWVEISQTAPVSRRAAWRQLMAAARFHAQRERPACQTLILSSQADRLVNPICSEHLENAWQVAHQRHPWAGHDLPHDDPQWVCESVGMFDARQ
jgi:pimeloyl-ACP methyl ester carboxylesterase